MKSKVFWSLFAFIAAVTLTITASAFMGGDGDSSKLDDPFWEVIDPEGNLADPDNYRPYSGTGTPSCFGDQDICVIQAPSSGGMNPLPVISSVTDLEAELLHFEEFGIPNYQSGAVQYKP